MFIIAVEKKPQGGPVAAQGMIVLCTVLGDTIDHTHFTDHLFCTQCVVNSIWWEDRGFGG